MGDPEDLSCGPVYSEPNLLVLSPTEMDEVQSTISCVMDAVFVESVPVSGHRGREPR